MCCALKSTDGLARRAAIMVGGAGNNCCFRWRARTGGNDLQVSAKKKADAPGMSTWRSPLFGRGVSATLTKIYIVELDCAHLLMCYNYQVTTTGIVAYQILMTLHPIGQWTIPPDTKSVAQAAFPKGNVYMKMSEILGQLYCR